MVILFVPSLWLRGERFCLKPSKPVVLRNIGGDPEKIQLEVPLVTSSFPVGLLSEKQGKER